MSGRRHLYRIALDWTGNLGAGTSGYRAYSRDHIVNADGKPLIPGSADPAFLGDAGRWNPEELLLASVAACHQLWYLHLCANAGIVVTVYRDTPEGIMREDADGGGRFTEIVLRPEIWIASDNDEETARRLHAAAHAKCFIARSLAFPVRCEPSIHRGASIATGA